MDQDSLVRLLDLDLCIDYLIAEALFANWTDNCGNA